MTVYMFCYESQSIKVPIHCVMGYYLEELELEGSIIAVFWISSWSMSESLDSIQEKIEIGNQYYNVSEW